MAEFCLECLNRDMKMDYKKRHVVLDFDLCEGCGEWKMCVMRIRYEPIRILPRRIRRNSKKHDEK